MSLDKTLLTLRALRDGLKILWKPAAFWIAKDRVGIDEDEETVDAVRVAFHRSLILAYFNNKITCKKITKKFYLGIIYCRKFKVSTLCSF